MMLREAPVLALGWYLIQPPPNTANAPNLFAPVTQWERMGDEFKSYQECEAAIRFAHDMSRKLSPELHSAETLDAEKRWAHEHGRAFNPEAVQEFSDAMVCWSSDDLSSQKNKRGE